MHDCLLPELLDRIAKRGRGDVHVIERAYRHGGVLAEALEALAIQRVDTVLRVPVIIAAAPG